MTTLIFVALARGDRVYGYKAQFPDLPGVSVEGPDTAILLSKAREAIRLALQGMADDGLEWPSATPIEQVNVEAGTVPFLVDVAVEDPAVRVNISIGERLLKRIDEAAEAAGMSRSGYIAAAVRASLGDRPKGPVAELDAVAKSLQEDWSALSRKITESLGPNSTFNRNLAELDKRVSESIRKTAETISAAMARRVEADGASTPGKRPRPETEREPMN
jgi:predicted RNase H-like HicB family nuclease